MVSLVKTYNKIRCLLGREVSNEPRTEQEDTASGQDLELNDNAGGSGTPNTIGPVAIPQTNGIQGGLTTGRNRTLLARMGEWALGHIGHVSIPLGVWMLANSVLLVQPATSSKALLFSWIASFGTFQALMWIKRASISTTSQTSLDYMILHFVGGLLVVGVCYFVVNNLGDIGDAQILPLFSTIVAGLSHRFTWKG